MASVEQSLCISFYGHVSTVKLSPSRTTRNNLEFQNQVVLEPEILQFRNRTINDFGTGPASAFLEAQGVGECNRLLTTFTADWARFRSLLLPQSQIESETRERTNLIEEIESLINSKQPEQG